MAYTPLWPGLSPVNSQMQNTANSSAQPDSLAELMKNIFMQQQNGVHAPTSAPAKTAAKTDALGATGAAGPGAHPALGSDPTMYGPHDQIHSHDSQGNLVPNTNQSGLAGAMQQQSQDAKDVSMARLGMQRDLLIPKHETNLLGPAAFHNTGGPNDTFQARPGTPEFQGPNPWTGPSVAPQLGSPRVPNWTPHAANAAFNVPAPLTGPTGNSSTDSADLHANLAMAQPGGANFWAPSGGAPGPVGSPGPTATPGGLPINSNMLPPGKAPLIPPPNVGGSPRPGSSFGFNPSSTPVPQR